MISPLLARWLTEGEIDTLLTVVELLACLLIGANYATQLATNCSQLTQLTVKKYQNMPIFTQSNRVCIYKQCMIRARHKEAY